MKELILKLSSQFMIENPSINTSINFSKSSDAIEGMIDNDANITFSTRIFSVDEIKLVAEKYRSIGVTTAFARDILKIMVNNNNPIQNISNDDLFSILTCTKTNWNFLTTKNSNIDIFMISDLAENDSPVKRLILRNQKVCNSINTFDEASKIIEMVLKDENAIGITGILNDERVKTISVNGIFPGTNEIINRRYSLEYYLYFLTVAEPKGNTKIFIDWVLSTKGQKIIEELGFGALFTTTH
jgi:phosphate transport system substrate-binding protein